jgi:hypothetical protein
VDYLLLSTYYLFLYSFPKDGAPRQLRNIGSYCYANSLLQNIVASEPMRNAIMNRVSEKDESHGHFPCMVLEYLKDALSQLYSVNGRSVLDPIHVSLILH